MSRGARGVEIEELHVHVGPIGQICRRGMLAKGPIICQPDSIAEFLICTAAYIDLNLSTDEESGKSARGNK